MMNEFNCLYCNKKYKQKYNYIRHVNICKFLKSSVKEQNDNIELESEYIPNPYEMFQLIKELNLENESLKKRLLKLETKSSTTKKINFLEWLQTYKPCITFEKWLTQEIYPNIGDYLDVVFNKDLFQAIDKLLKQYFNTCKDVMVPICCYQKNKVNNIYVYDMFDGVETWQQISNTILEKYLSHFCDQFIVAFTEIWYKKHKELIETSEKYQELYMENYKKILGGKENKDILYGKIKLSLCGLVKKTPKVATIN